MKHFILFLSCLLVTSLKAQYSADGKDSLVIDYQLDSTLIIVEFASDVFTLDKEEEKRMKEIYWDMSATRRISVHISGHTDSHGSNAYNQKLSEKRMEGVYQTLKAMDSSFNQFELNYFGEERLLNKEANGQEEKQNRRVEIKIYFERRIERWIPCRGYSPCPDTLIVLPGGTYYKVNVCELRAHPGCISISEVITGEQIRREGFTTMDQNNEPLTSAGMLKYAICDSVKINVFLPVNESCFEPDMQFYRGTENGWVVDPDYPLQIIENNGIRYYSFPLQGVGSMNLDKISFPGPPPPKMKFKGKGGIRLTRVEVACDCPLSVVAASPKRVNARKIKMPRICCAEPMVKVQAVNKKGEKLYSDFVPLDTLDELHFIGGCKAEEKWRFLIFKKRKKTVFRTYRVRKRHFS